MCLQQQAEQSSQAALFRQLAAIRESDSAAASPAGSAGSRMPLAPWGSASPQSSGVFANAGRDQASRGAAPAPALPLTMDLQVQTGVGVGLAGPGLRGGLRGGAPVPLAAPACGPRPWLANSIPCRVCHVWPWLIATRHPPPFWAGLLEPLNAKQICFDAHPLILPASACCTALCGHAHLHQEDKDTLGWQDQPAVVSPAAGGTPRSTAGAPAAAAGADHQLGSAGKQLPAAAAAGPDAPRPRVSASRRVLEEAGILVEAGTDAARAQQWRDELFAELDVGRERMRAQRESFMVRPPLTMSGGGE